MPKGRGRRWEGGREGGIERMGLSVCERVGRQAKGRPRRLSSGNKEGQNDAVVESSVAWLV